MTKRTILSAVILLVAVAFAAGAETKGDITFAMYRGAGWVVLPQFAGLLEHKSDLLWVSAEDKTGKATHMVFTLACAGLANETQIAPTQAGRPATVIYERDRKQACSVSIEAVVAGERQVFSAPGE